MPIHANAHHSAVVLRGRVLSFVVRSERKDMRDGMLACTLLLSGVRFAPWLSRR